MAESKNADEKDDAPEMPVARGGTSWWPLAVFALAFAARVAYAVAIDPGPTDMHQYKTYYWNGLRIAAHPRPLEYVARSDGWHTWDAPIMTVAPLYHLMLGAFFRWFGPGLLGLRVLQAALGASAAVGVASLGRRLAGRHGIWAGVAYALHWPALEMSCWTLTENLHTPLLVAALGLLVSGVEGGAGPVGRGFAGGLMLGLSALARSVSSAFAPLLLVWRLTIDGLSAAALRRNLRPTLLVALGCLLAVLPWAARNRLLGKDVVIETVGFFNLWDDNARGLVSNDRYVRQFEALLGQEKPGTFGRMAADYAWRNIVRNPEAFLAKVDANFWHFFRPERLYNFLVKEAAYSEGPWINASRLLLDDALLMLALPLFAAFVVAGAPSPTRRLIVAWAAYYLVITLVAFHSEVRYRSALTPFVLAGAAGGFASVARGSRRRRPFAWAGFLAGALLVATVSQAELVAAWEGIASYRAFRPAAAAAERGDPAAAMRLAAAAADLDPGAVRPWLRCGRLMAAHDRPAEAVDAYERALRATDGLSWTAILALPRLLAASGRLDEAERAGDAVNRLSLRADPSALLELAWREMPPPRADEILFGENDYGAARGFHRPGGVGEKRQGAPVPGLNRPPPGAHRWTRGRAWIRLRPIERAEAYDVAITMGSPFPSPRAHPVVEVRVNDGEPARIELGPEIRVYHVRATQPRDEPLVVRLDAPTWTRVGEAPDQGVRVDALRVAPAPGAIAAAAAPIDLGYSHQTAFAVDAPDLEGLQAYLGPALERNRKEFIGAAGPVRGFGAGDVYPQIWLRDSATLLPLSRYLYSREYLASWLEEHFAHQDANGELLDWVAAGPVSAFAPWAPRARALSAPGSPPLTGDKNSVEADQESSAVLALSDVFRVTGDRGWLLENVGGHTLLERADRALRYLVSQRMDPRQGLITSGFSADWGDVSPVHPDQQAIYLDARTPLVTGLYTNAMFVAAATGLAEAFGARGDEARATFWRAEATAVKARVNERLWQETRGFYRMHLPSGPVAPPAFDDSDIFAMGGNAVALLAGLADEPRARRILTVAESRRQAHGISTIAAVLLPPYPRGLFKHPAMSEEYSYQNGGQWDWFSGRLLRAAFGEGQSDWARRNLLTVAKRVVSSRGLYEWSTRLGQGRGSSTYAGSAGALAQAVFEGLFGISLAADQASIAVRLGDISGRIHLYEPATDTYIAYDYRASPTTLDLRYESNHRHGGRVSVLIPADRRIVGARWDGKPVALEQVHRGEDAYASIPTDWAPHRLSLETAPLVRESGRTRSSP